MASIQKVLSRNPLRVGIGVAINLAGALAVIQQI